MEKSTLSNFRVWPEYYKPRTFISLNDIPMVFTKNDLVNAHIDILIGCIVISRLDRMEVEHLINELF